MLHVRICAGGRWQQRFLPRSPFLVDIVVLLVIIAGYATTKADYEVKIGTVTYFLDKIKS